MQALTHARCCQHSATGDPLWLDRKTRTNEGITSQERSILNLFYWCRSVSFGGLSRVCSVCTVNFERVAIRCWVQTGVARIQADQCLPHDAHAHAHDDCIPTIESITCASVHSKVGLVHFRHISLHRLQRRFPHLTQNISLASSSRSTPAGSVSPLATRRPGPGKHSVAFTMKAQDRSSRVEDVCVK